ncbi:S41 family peptidase [Actinocrispum wychmicini]|uniref:Peptidase S41-like protein n=1 Tax=Actinocrispum wychmicini TaxID=1213861 RepID=A0A4R2J0B6_9PSEU|nr:S41 family peptidase [Actinocrispum wychmicini]TCO50742.1 peptidase S41-like protein [Actinocrispum wychmicini]
MTGFSGYVDPSYFQADSDVLNSALDEIFTQNPVCKLRGLIVDVRDNKGGSDALGLQLAARLSGSSYRAYAVQARNDATDPTRFTRPQPQWVEPNGRTAYTGPIALLTSPLTKSAGETFTQAMMSRTPTPYRIGENTQGVFSDVLNRALPNGWVFGLPNEEFRTRAGTTFDGAGIPPHKVTPGVFSDYELDNNLDTSFDAAVAYLASVR